MKPHISKVNGTWVYWTDRSKKTALTLYTGKKPRGFFRHIAHLQRYMK